MAVNGGHGWPELRAALLYGISVAVVLWARLWQAFWPLFCLIMAGIGLAAMGMMPKALWAHWLALGLFACGCLWLLWLRLPLFRWPRRGEVELAMEKAGGLSHRPLAALRDRQIEPNAENAALWQRHRDRMRETLSKVRRARYRTAAPQEDRFGLRLAAMILLLVGILTGGRETPQLLHDALTPTLPQGAGMTPTALDIWVEPPAYTQLAPVYLSRAQNASAQAVASARVPAGSTVKLRLSGRKAAPVIFMGDTRMRAADAGAGNYTAEFKLDAGGTLRLRQGLRRLGQWPLAVTPDMPPMVRIEDAGKGPREALCLLWRMRDDYGVTQLDAVIVPPPALQREIDEADLTVPLPVPPPPEAGKPLDGAYTYLADLTGHPLAGNTVHIQLIATDALGQKGRSELFEVHLPEREFRNPVAQRLMQERRRLLHFGDSVFTPYLTSAALLNIVNRPQAYRGDMKIFLGLVMAIKRIGYDGGREALTSVRDLLWDLALRAEDGGVSEAARALQAALDTLSAALANPDTPKDKLQEMMQQMQEKMRDYLQAMAQEMQARQQDGTAMALPPQLADKVMKQLDINEFMQRLQEGMAGGDRDQMRQMMETLRQAVASTDINAQLARQQQQRQALQALSDLEDLVREQQKLAEDTARGEEPPQELAKRQQALEKKLDQIRKTLPAALPGTRKNLDTAKKEMGQCTGALGNNDAKSALAAQRKILQELTAAQDQAAQSIAQAMRNMLMMGMGMQQQSGGYGEGFDPLGRPQPDGKAGGGKIGIPDEGERRRVQDIQRELRMRYNDSLRPETERDYLERLLDLFE